MPTLSQSLPVLAFTLALTVVAGTAMAAPTPRLLSQRATQTFNRLDHNHDGKITRAEFFEHYGERANKRRAFALIDDNHTGVISRKEWMRHQGLVYKL